MQRRNTENPPGGPDVPARPSVVPAVGALGKGGPTGRQLNGSWFPSVSCSPGRYNWSTPEMPQPLP